MLLNNSLKLNYPESFHEMDSEELSKLKLMAEGPGLCIKNDELHMVISAGWKKMNVFLNLFLDEKDIAGTMKQNIRKMTEPFQFHNEEEIWTEIGGIKAEGIRYKYNAEKIEMISESYVLRSKNTIYYFHCYTRAALFNENREIWNDILNSAYWL